jgi:hypothetical protein
VLISHGDILLVINSLQPSLSGKETIILSQCNKAVSSIKTYQILITPIAALVEAIGNLSLHTKNIADFAIIKTADFDFRH